MIVGATSGAGFDPMFLQYMNNPMNATFSNPYFMQAYNFAPTTFKGQTEAATALEQETQNNSTAFKGGATVEDLETAKKSSGLGFLTGVGVLGAASLITAAVVGKGKVGSGYKEMWNWAKTQGGKIFKRGKNSESAVKKPSQFTIRKNGGETIVTMPGMKNRISGTEAEIKSALNKAGITHTGAPEITTAKKVGSKTVNTFAEGIKGNYYTFNYGKRTYTVIGGKITKVVDSKTKKELPQALEKLNNPVSGNETNLKEQIGKMVEGFEKGENLDKLNILRFSHTDENGVIRFYEKAKGSNTVKLTGAITDRFNANTTKVKAFLEKNQSADDMMKLFNEGKFSELGIKSAEYQARIGGENCKFFIEGDKITAIKINGKTYKEGSDEFLAKLHDNKDAFENVLKNKGSFTNVVYM